MGKECRRLTKNKCKSQEIMVAYLGVVVPDGGGERKGEQFAENQISVKKRNQGMHLD